MKIKSMMCVTAGALFFPLTNFAQTPPPPPQAAAPPAPSPAQPAPDKRPKVPVTFLGVETSEVPSVVSEQLGLANGFGLVVDYVVPDGPAATAGLHQNDILKMLNDQILIDPEQLAKLVRSFSEGTSVTLTVLRKGAETKVTAKLGRKEIPAGHGMQPGFEKHWNFNGDLGDLNNGVNDLRRELDSNNTVIQNTVRRATMEAMRARDEAMRQGEEARRAAEQFRIHSADMNGALRTTRIDLGQAQIVFSDDKGELKIDTADGRRILTAKDPQGRLLFSGPVDTPDELSKMPADIRARYDKLELKDLPPPPPPAPLSPIAPIAPVAPIDAHGADAESPDQAATHANSEARSVISI